MTGSRILIRIEPNEPNDNTMGERAEAIITAILHEMLCDFVIERKDY